MLTSPYLQELLSLFKKHNLRYLIIGSHAEMRYARFG